MLMAEHDLQLRELCKEREKSVLQHSQLLLGGWQNTVNLIETDFFIKIKMPQLWLKWLLCYAFYAGMIVLYVSKMIMMNTIEFQTPNLVFTKDSIDFEPFS